MPRFRVKHDYREGHRVENYPAAVVEVDVSDETKLKEAVEKVCGEPLRLDGPYTKYRAQVWPVGGVRDTNEIRIFFSL